MADKFFVEDGMVIRQHTFDPTPTLDRAAAMRDLNGGVVNKDMWLVASLPWDLVIIWAKEAGIRVDDQEAMDAMLLRKMNDPDFNLFRVHGGQL